MTEDGKKKLEQELEDLRLVRRPEVINRIKIARSYGTYPKIGIRIAKDEQAFVEGRISQIETMLQYAIIIDNDAVDRTKFQWGVKLLSKSYQMKSPKRTRSSVNQNPTR